MLQPEAVVDRVLNEHPDGFTIDLNSGAPAPFDVNTYFVSLDGYERAYDGIPTPREAASWIRANRKVLRRPGHYLGGWRNEEDGRFYLDVTLGVQGLSEAIALAQRQSQRCIYHPVSGKTIWLVQAAAASAPGELCGG